VAGEFEAGGRRIEHVCVSVSVGCLRFDIALPECPLVPNLQSSGHGGGRNIPIQAQHIVAESTSLTGSIGVIAGRFVTGRFQQELLGISHDTLKRGANADYFSSLEPFSPSQRQRFVAMMSTIYDTFIDHVASGRDMDREAVEAVAQGRVWSGQRALELGLVDELGGFDSALRAAAEAAEIDLDEARLVYYPKPPSLFDFLSGQGTSGLFASWLHNRLELSFDVPAELELRPETARFSRPF